MGSPPFSNGRTGTGAQARWVGDLTRGRRPGPRLPHHLVVEDPQAGLATLGVHAGTYEDPVTGAVGTPVFASTTFRFTPDTYDAFQEGFLRDVPTYARYGNPTQWACQEKIAALEHAESALVTASGMAATTTTLLGLSNAGGNIISSYDIYGGSYNLLREDLPQLGRSVTFVDPLDLDAVRAAIRPSTQIMFFEVLSNPLLKALPLVELAALCRDNDILLVVDNTFLTPLSCRPLEYGADIVVHSATKYLNGHSDVTCGAVAGSRKLVDRVWAQMLKFGGCLDPLACFLLERGMKTLSARMRVHAENAVAVTQFLEGHPDVVKVHSPYAGDYPYPWLREYCHTVACGIVTFALAGGNGAALELMRQVRLPKAATSLGGVESLISLPFNTSHSSLTESQQTAVGLLPGTVRLSVGIEDADDLVKDLSEALARVRGGAR